MTLLKVALWTALFWLLLCVPTLVLWAPQTAGTPIHLAKPDYIDASPSLFVGQIQETVFELARKCPLPPRQRLIVLGASGSRGFDARALRAAMGVEEAINVSVVLSNFTQIRQVFGDLRACLGEEGARRSAFVLVPALGSFVADSRRWSGPYTDYETEKLRSGLFAGAPGHVQPRVPVPTLRLLVSLSRPLLLLRKTRLTLTRQWRVLRGVEHEYDPAVPLLDHEQSLQMITGLQPELATGGPYAPEQTAALEALIDDIRASGAGLAVVDQPAQRWLRETGPAFGAAHRALMSVVARKGVPYLDLSATGTDAEFRDPMHANALGSPAWTQRLAEGLIRLHATNPRVFGSVTPGAFP